MAKSKARMEVTCYCCGIGGVWPYANEHDPRSLVEGIVSLSAGGWGMVLGCTMCPECFDDYNDMMEELQGEAL
jgi:hypothetical protein